MPVPVRPRAGLALLLALAACAAPPRSAPAQEAGGAPRRVASATGFRTPESVRYDPEQDVYFVSNVGGNPSARDGDGFIARLGPDGAVREMRWVAGGRGGVVLHAPKGMALRGDTLWVAGLDAVRAFHRRTGAPLGGVELGGRGATFLNDVAVGTDGALYVTDTGIAIDDGGRTTHPGVDRIFRLSAAGVEVAAEGDGLELPNGIAAEPGGGFLLAPAGGRAVSRWRPDGGAPRAVAGGPGGYDGVEVLADGSALVTSWADSAVHVLRGGVLRPLIRGVPSPADPGVDTRRGRIAIPLFREDRVEIWTLPGGGR